MGAVMGGFGGYSSMDLAKGFGAVGGMNAAGSTAGAAGNAAGYTGANGEIGSALMTASKGMPLGLGPTGEIIQGATMNQGLNVPGASMMNNPNVINAVQNTTAAGQGAGSGMGDFMTKEMEQLSKMGSGVKNLSGFGEPSTSSAWDVFKNAYADPKTGTKALTDLGAMAKVGMPLGGAVLGGLEPSDIYGEPIDMSAAKEKEKYDPNSRLNLSGDTGLRLYALGGAVNTNPSVGGGLSDLYNRPEGQTLENISQDGYGIGRLNNLANAEALNTARITGYAMGGPVSFADGGDSNKEDTMLAPIDENMGIASLTPTTPSTTGQAMQPGQVQNTATALSNTASSDSGIVAQVATNLRNDPNYQPKNPIEAAIVKQIKGTDSMQQGQPSQQGLGSIAPSQPMAPSYNPSVAMGPTYFAGMNAPRGYAEGGETHLNLDQLPSLNVETGESNYMTPDGGGMYAGRLMKDAYRQNPDNPMFRLLSRMPDNMVFNRQMARGGYLDGQGDGMSDSIPATIEGKQPARLADGEFVVPADVVSHLGNGSSKAGSKRLYAMLDKVRKARTGHTKQGKQIKPEKYMPA